MTTRRIFLGLGGLGLVGGLVSACGGGAEPADEASVPPVARPAPTPGTGWQMPDEGSAQRAVWMAFAARESVWGAELRQPVQQDLARIANAIGRYTPVRMLVNSSDLATARQLCSANVQLIEHPIDDLWMRDTGCVFVRNARGGVISLSVQKTRLRATG